MSTEQSRAAFEKFMEERFGDLVDRRRALNGDKEYMSLDMAMPWVAWQSSRAALVVELPEKFEVEMGAYGTAEVI
ncbi:hypothetical protein [Symbiopectobacterium purcellii]|uniref:hypothetical protein n=1 Tax=Symbiopectobacterium purcellii TaxID=2871826 RepID=UPI003F82531F